MEKTKKNWFVANDNGEILAHDMSEYSAKALAEQKQDEEPDQGWEALAADGCN